MPTTFNDLVNLMQRLRSPNGCPWDREQTYATLAPMLLEEAYEAFEAVEDAREGRPAQLHEEIKTSLLNGVSSKAPALMEAHQLSTKAARVGFDWKSVDDIFDKLQEEIEELRTAIREHASLQDEANHARVREEMGDLLFAATNIARHMQVEPEAALKLTNRKFRQRFEYIENALHDRGQAFDQTSIEELEELWQEAKTKSTDYTDRSA